VRQNRKTEKSKKQLIKVGALPKKVRDIYYNGPDENMYVGCGTNMSFVSSPSDGRRQCTRFVSCRDYMHEMVRTHVFKNNGYVSGHYTYGENPPIDMEKFRLLVAINTEKCSQYGPAKSKEDFKNRLFSAKRIINFYEEVAKFDRTRITTANHETVKNTWLFTGPKEWMSHPALLSMATLIVKFSLKHEPIEFSNKEDLEKLLSVANNYSNYMKSYYRKLYIVAKRHKDIFKGTIEDAYGVTPKNGGSYHANVGIVRLCCYEHLDMELNKRMKKIVEEEEGGK